MPTHPPDLPPLFFLYIRSSNTFVLLGAAPSATDGWFLTIAPKTSASAGSYTVPHTESIADATTFHGKYTFHTQGPDGTTTTNSRNVYATLVALPDGSTKPAICASPAGNAIPILEFKHTGIFKGRRLVPNAHTLPLEAATQYIDSSGNVISEGNTIQHAGAPTTRRLKKPKAPAGDLSIHVARQLLELVQLKKEQCPITVEDYITGQTAVMPCGHLFMQMAIEETFKKEPNICPWCRQHGRPTFV